MEATSFRNLQKARIYPVGQDRQKAGPEVTCMFNPYEYRISKTNTFRETSQNDSDTQSADLASAGAPQLNLSLMFDTYESGGDVSQITRQLWRFMMTKDQPQSGLGEKIPPPQVAFEWGVFRFVAHITQMTQTFTLFKADGTPVRAKVDVTFTQYTDVEDYKPQNPTSIGLVSARVWRVKAGDRLDTIAAEVYRDAGQWRRIAEYNQIVNPLALRPGQSLQIPLD